MHHVHLKKKKIFHEVIDFPAIFAVRRYAKHGYCHHQDVCRFVCPSVCHSQWDGDGERKGRELRRLLSRCLRPPSRSAANFSHSLISRSIMSFGALLVAAFLLTASISKHTPITNSTTILEYIRNTAAGFYISRLLRQCILHNRIFIHQMAPAAASE